MSSYTESQLVNILKKASDAYYNNKSEGLLGDEQYDALRDELEERFPNNPYLKQIGAPIEKGAVKLPYKMASLNKIKPGTGAVDSFVSSSKKKEWVLSDKLDGISVLWDTGKRKLYLRGDGLMGVDVSVFAPYLSGLTPRCFNQSWVIRGELVLPHAVPIEGTLSRSWVNGQLHQKTPIPEQLGKIRFVAYELVVPSTFTRSQQFTMLSEAGFEVPPYEVAYSLDDEELSAYLKERRQSSLYPIDGIVVGENSIPIKDAGQEVTNPKDMRAFKMPLEDQKATTKVVDIVWSASHQGYWIPRIQIEPVNIGGSRIEFLTGHNARMIVTHQIGKGATIVIRKSGDVIPTLESVVSRGSAPILPEGEWDGDAQKASHYKVKTGTTTQEMLQKKLEHFAKTLDIPHLGPGLIAKLVEAGKRTPNDLIRITQSEMEVILGKGMAIKIFPALQNKLGTCTELEIMIASSMMPRGVGSSKLQALFLQQTDPRNWQTIRRCEGWSEDALASFLTELSRYEAWRRTELSAIPYPRLTEWSGAAVAAESKGVVCLTGFRNADFQKQMEESGFTFVNSVTKKTTLLIVKDLDDTSEKMKKAQELGIRILTLSQAKAEYL
jgi:NAD-dependent DNA ligase